MTRLLRFLRALLRRPTSAPALKQAFIATSEQCLYVTPGVRLISVTCRNPDGSVTEFIDPDTGATGWVTLRLDPVTGRYRWQADDGERSWED